MFSSLILGGVHNSLIMSVARLREQSLYVARKFLSGMTRRIFQRGNFSLLVSHATMFEEELTRERFLPLDFIGLLVPRRVVEEVLC
ncbi:unnamed protein product [Trifolium pratense]|uniref:Uncharacterized protein n=1 Tax=Trifolium pratense TaxID=57577 RepID=A0ACB0I7K3_TRIPR|nr:unnamed protein product [Trifolium pratense]